MPDYLFYFLNKLDGIANWLFSPGALTPHGFRLLWEPSLIWAYAISDVTIGIAYFTIPLALIVFAKQRGDLVFRPVLWLSVAFILLCGATHWLDVLTLWLPLYRVEVLVKGATALAAIITAIVLWWLMPKAVALPSSVQLLKANMALHESEERFRVSFENAPLPLQTLDTAGVIAAVSNSWLDLFGYSREEVVGRHISSLWAPGTLHWNKTEIAEFIEGGGLRSETERQYIRKDGTLVDVLVSFCIERMAGRTWIVCGVIDITARRRAEKALQATEERLHQVQKMESLGRLTGGIAHDFNNMLQSIGAALDLMERRILHGRSEDAVRFAHMARQSLESAAGLTHRMLAFARRQTLQPKSIDPDELVRGMEELIARSLGPSIKLELDLGGNGWRVLCDANQLESALLNLAINARDAITESGTFSLTTAARHLNQIDLADQLETEPGDFVEIAARDTGMGMAPEILTQVFEPFFTTKPIGRGTGLGLSQLHGFVQQSGGFVRLESKLGGGTTVRLYLPRLDPAEPMADKFSKQAGNAPRLNDAVSEKAFGTILVVEDEAGVRNPIVEALRDLGCGVLEAIDGTAGLRIVQSGTHVDMLVTDVGLPGLNGRQLADAAREQRPRLPVLLMTGYAGGALENAEFAPGMEILHKPFDLEILVAKVQAMLQPDTLAGP